MFKSFIQKRLESYVMTYMRTHPDVKLVMVTGSVGKTSTKIAIATVLSEKFRVRVHEGNHNAELSAPLAVLGIEYPDSIRNIGAWLSVFSAARQRIRQPTDVDVIVQEIGSDRIGQVPHASTYLHPDIAVVTAVSPEHMEYFGTIDEVAKEELAAANFAKQALINRDDIDGTYAKYLTNQNISTYGSSASAEYYFIDDDFSVEAGYSGTFVAKEWDNPVPATIKVLGEHSTRPAIAAAAVGVKLGMSADQIAAGLGNIQAVNGRMNVLRGVQDTLIIDDTYNSSPLAATSALRALYSLTVPQKIAVLGSMNELGDSSDAEHQMLGRMCDPAQLAWVVTVGDQAEKHIASAAKAQGCQVKSFKTALQAGAFVHQVIEPHAAVLFKGSEGSVYLEEAVKILLHTTTDETYLVRQSAAWQARKTAFFSRSV
jgi:UDP-N-acetylmuramoyl-tripeptide--D-alanyl-D-alanine ligase